MTREQESIIRTTLICDECNRRVVTEEREYPDGWFSCPHPTSWDFGQVVFDSKDCAKAYIVRTIDAL